MVLALTCHSTSFTDLNFLSFRYQSFSFHCKFYNLSHLFTFRLFVFARSLLSVSALDSFSSTALFIFFTASTWAWVIWINFVFFSLNRLFRTGFIFICTGYLCNLFSFYFLFNSYMIQQTNRCLLNSRSCSASGNSASFSS